MKTMKLERYRRPHKNLISIEQQKITNKASNKSFQFSTIVSTKIMDFLSAHSNRALV